MTEPQDLVLGPGRLRDADASGSRDDLCGNRLRPNDRRTLLRERDRAGSRWAPRLASDALLTKLLRAWHLEGMVFDWANTERGSGRAVDSVIGILPTYRPSAT